MDFLDQFEGEHRELFESAASVLQLQRGQYLVHRRDPGGDIYVLREGQLEVVDSRSTPEVILVLLEPGAVVGELAFVDDSPRSADVRASRDSEVLVWHRDDLHRVLNRNAALSAAFYRVIAGVAAGLVRRVTTNAMVGALGGSSRAGGVGPARVTDDAMRVAQLVKDGLVDAEARLRHDAGDKVAQGQVNTLFDRLQREVATLFVAHPDVDAATALERVLGRELNPYLVRSSLAERCIRRPQGRSATEEIMAHVLVGAPGGDGQLGEIFDQWLLDRPTLKALRSFKNPITERAKQLLPVHRNRRMLLVNAGTGSLVASLVRSLSERPTLLTVLDQSRDALSFLDVGMASSAVEIRTVQENLVQFAQGRGRTALAKQDLVILHGLVEYMPDRVVVAMLDTCRELLSKKGQVIVAALGASDDATLLDRLLRWPTVRRTEEQLARTFAGAGLQVTWSADLPPPALVVSGGHKSSP